MTSGRVRAGFRRARQAAGARQPGETWQTRPRTPGRIQNKHKAPATPRQAHPETAQTGKEPPEERQTGQVKRQVLPGVFPQRSAGRRLARLIGLMEPLQKMNAWRLAHDWM